MKVNLVKLVCTQCKSEIGTINQDFTFQVDKTGIHICLTQTKNLKKVQPDKEREKLKKGKKKKFYLLCSNDHKIGSEFVDGSCFADGTDTSVLDENNKLTVTVNWKKSKAAKAFLKPFELEKKEKETKKKTEKKPTNENRKEKKPFKKETKIDESKIPSNPPFVAFVGSLPLTATKDDLTKLFGNQV
jgi:hypothetical protein